MQLIQEVVAVSELLLFRNILTSRPLLRPALRASTPLSHQSPLRQAQGNAHKERRPYQGILRLHFFSTPHSFFQSRLSPLASRNEVVSPLKSGLRTASFYLRRGHKTLAYGGPAFPVSLLASRNEVVSPLKSGLRTASFYLRRGHKTLAYGGPAFPVSLLASRNEVVSPLKSGLQTASFYLRRGHKTLAYGGPAFPVSLLASRNEVVSPLKSGLRTASLPVSQRSDLASDSEAI